MSTTVLHETASQTAGPYLHIGLAPQRVALDAPAPLVLDGESSSKERIRVEGRILDGAGAVVRDALIEYRHTDDDGRYRQAWGRACSDFDSGEFAFDTVRPGADASGQAPHVLLWIVARGINLGLHTRMYFADNAALHATDPVLQALAPPRRATLIAARTNRDTLAVYRFELRLQGADETVFFDV
jgi:protocatechuate 3,4-dioxygenase alpha subunit